MLGKTIIAGCGAYTEFLGHLVLDISKQGLSLDSYKLHKMDKDIKEDVLIDYTNQLMEQGISLREAVVEAAATRLKPVVMTV